MDVLNSTSQAELAKTELGARLREVFWDIYVDQLDFEKHAKLVITQVLNFGSEELIHYLFQIYKEEAIKESLVHPTRGVWFPRTYRAYCKLLDIVPDRKAINILHREGTTRRHRDNVLLRE